MLAVDQHIKSIYEYIMFDIGWALLLIKKKHVTHHFIKIFPMRTHCFRIGKEDIGYIKVKVKIILLSWLHEYSTYIWETETLLG